MALSLNGNFATLADFNLREAAKPVLARERDVQRKRRARALAAAKREHDRKIEARQQEIEAKRASLVIVCADGRTIRPIK